MNRIFFDPQAGQGAGGTMTPPATAMKSIEELMADNITRSAAGKTATIEVTVISISDWRPTRNGGLPVKMVVTDKGNFWPLATAIKNCPKSFLKPVLAKAVLLPRLDAQGNQRLNMSQLEFEGLATETALMIAEMPAGTALFAITK